MVLYECINATFGYQVQPPANWDIQDQAGGSTIIFFCPIEEKSEQMRENINIHVDDLTNSPMTLDDYSNASMNGFETMLGDFSIIEPVEKTTLGGLAAEKLSFFGTLQNIRFKFKSIYGVDSKNAYVLTYTAIESSYPNFLPNFEKFVASFQPNSQ